MSSQHDCMFYLPNAYSPDTKHTLGMRVPDSTFQALFPPKRGYLALTLLPLHVYCPYWQCGKGAFQNIFHQMMTTIYPCCFTFGLIKYSVFPRPDLPGCPNSGSVVNTLRMSASTNSRQASLTSSRSFNRCHFLR
jgi:hypothetical protein